MKNAIIASCIAVFVLSAGAGTAIAVGDSGKLTATVNNVTPAMAEGEYSSVSVIDEYGGPVIFDVASTAVITDAAGDPIGVRDIRQNDTVEIEYTDLSGGLGLATSIKRTNR